MFCHRLARKLRAGRWRKLHNPLGSGKPIHIVGGFYEMARVSAVGVEKRIVREWPDEVGKPISVADAVA